MLAVGGIGSCLRERLRLIVRFVQKNLVGMFSSLRFRSEHLIRTLAPLRHGKYGI